MSEWQPIETAPKELAVLVFADPFVFTALQELDRLGASYWYALIGDEVPSSEDTSTLLDEVTRWGNPTHWMPLPSPPPASPYLRDTSCLSATERALEIAREALAVILNDTQHEKNEWEMVRAGARYQDIAERALSAITTLLGEKG